MSTGKKIQGALSYNEHKVQQGTAELMLASKFGGEVSEMGFSEKLHRFEKLNRLKPKTKTNTLHLSLSFSPEDQLDDEKLRQMAVDYIERIGFGDQPFLVYKHTDTGNTHLHILTTTIQSNGKPIYLHNLAKRKSEPARKAIEMEYGLIKAEGRKQTSYLGVSTKISNIVSQVVDQYKFKSFEEFNAILRQFNVMAERGNPGSFLFEKGGLIYCKIDENGYKTGKSIKASSIFKSPTISVLEKKFQQNAHVKVFYKSKVEKKVAEVLVKSSSTFDFLQNLKSKDVGCSVEYSSDGAISNVSFVDHKAKTVFRCEDIGITVPGLLEKLNYQQQVQTVDDRPLPTDSKMPSVYQENEKPANIHQTSNYPFIIIKTLFSSDHYQPEISPEFLKKKRKKKKR